MKPCVEQTSAGNQPARASLIRRWGSVLWPSFLCAALATSVFFANIDPDDLRATTFPNLEISRRLGYTIGFFMFWCVAACSSFLTLFLLSPNRDRSNDAEQ